MRIVTYRGRRSPQEARKSAAPSRGAQLEKGKHLVGLCCCFSLYPYLHFQGPFQWAYATETKELYSRVLHSGWGSYAFVEQLK